MNARARPPGEVRIVGGLWKRSRLPVPDVAGLRPTPDRVRETLFNWLGGSLEGWRCIDAFAGSGVLGFEAASRGAAEVVLVERDAALVRGLEASRTRLKADPARLRIERGDATAWLARAPRAAWDLVFLDPPYEAGLMPAALLATAPLLVPGGWVYVEGSAFLDGDALAADLEEHRRVRAGAVHAQLLRRAG